MDKKNNYTFLRLRVVMVNTTEPGNIGAAARAMKNMCLSKLYLVKPKQYPAAAATARASNADDILQQARQCETLAEAIADCHLVIGSTVRQRRLKLPQLDVAAACEKIAKTLCHPQQQVAVLFGNEHSGLSNEQLDLCQILMTIPGNTAYSSLNVAQAVQVFAYQFYLQNLQTHQQTQQKKIINTETPLLANNTELVYFYQHLEQVLLTLGYDDNDYTHLLTRRLRKLFARTQLYKDEVALLRGILNKIKPFAK